MSKFLQIIEGLKPTEDNSSKLGMVSALVTLIDTVPGIDVSVVDHNTFIINIKGHDITVDVRDIEGSVNEQAASSFNPVYNLDQGVEGIAAKALYRGPGSSMLGITTAQKANAAVKKREKVVKKAIPVYDNITKKLEAAITSALPLSNQYSSNPSVI
jgi:hypothetical protein